VTDHFEKSAAAVVVLLVVLQMLVESDYPVCEDSDLNFRRTCVAFMDGLLFDDLLLFFLCNHGFHLIKNICKRELRDRRVKRF